MSDEQSGPKHVDDAPAAVGADVEAEAGSGSDESGEIAAAPPVSAKPRKGGRVLASFALLLALGAGGAAGYVYYLTVYLNPLAGVDAQLAGVQTRVQASVQRTLSDSAAKSQVALDNAVAELQQSVAAEHQARLEAEEALSRSISEGLRLNPPSSREWKLAEVEYLLRIANHRVLMERDAAAAVQLLAAADEVLAELDDYALFPVRAQLAEERLALGNVEEIDVQGAFLRLEAIKAVLNELPLRLPEYLAERRVSKSPSDGAGFLAALSSRLSSFVEFRRYSAAGLRPLLSPDEAGYLEMNLRLMLERAQLAVLRRDPVLYEHSVAAALAWLDEYLDPTSPRVSDMQAELDDLLNLQLGRDLPDISGSMTNLRSLARYGIEDTEVEP